MDLFIAVLFAGPEQTGVQALAPQCVPIQTTSIIAHLDKNTAALVVGVQGDDSGLRLRPPFARRLNAVIETVADQVDQWIADFSMTVLSISVCSPLICNSTRVYPFLADVMHHARKAAEHRTDRQHANPHDVFLQVARVLRSS